MANAPGIVAAGAYAPKARMARATIAAAHAWAAPDLKSRAKGTRAFAAWDEDAITMAVEAARASLPPNARDAVKAVMLASTTLPFADRHNAGVLATALNLPQALHTLDIGGCQRAGTSALLNALSLAGKHPALVAAADRRHGKPGSAYEMIWGDGAAAVVVGTENVIARCLGTASSAVDFVDHFRETGADYDYVWEERWVRDEGHRKLVPPVVKAALKQAGIEPARVGHAIIPLGDSKSAEAVARDIGIAPTAVRDPFAADVGFTGVGHGLLILAATLEAAKPGEIILLTGFGQGCDALVFEVTDAIATYRPAKSLARVLAGAREDTAYMRFLSFNADIPFEWGMRAELDQKTALTAQYRSSEMVTGFMAGRCRQTGVVQFPKTRISVEPGHHTVDSFENCPLADEPAKVLSFAADWLSYSPSPPFSYGLVQFDIGARLTMEFVDASGIAAGTPLRMVFRIKDFDRKRGFRRYFWKATPLS